MKRLPSLIALCFLASSLWAQCDPADLLKRVDSLVSFLDSDFSAEYTFAENHAGEEPYSTQAAVFRRDSQDKYLILIMQPEVDRGKGYLKIGDNLWFYDPVPRQFLFSSSKDRFRNSNARNSDFTRSTFSTDYMVQSTGAERLGRFDCTLLDLKANTNEVTFPIAKLWVSADSLVRKMQDYSLSGQLLRTVLIPTYTGIGGRFVPRTIVVIDGLKGRNVDGRFVGDRTQITIAHPSLDKLPDNLFTKEYLEKVGK